MTFKTNFVRACAIGTLVLAVPALGEITTADGGKALTSISSDFAEWSGSTANSTSLASGLRNGTPITLTGNEVVNGRVVPTTVTFTPPTRPMGNGNVFIALSLAKAELAAQGVTSPTPTQLETALMGGTLRIGDPQRLTQTQGVLQLRGDGMGWGQIAQVYGFKLGPVISQMKAARPTFAATNLGTGTVTGTGATQRSAHSQGIVTGTGTGETQRSANSRGIVSAGRNAGATASGRGIVTAGGGAAAGAASANAASRGIVNASGAGLGGGNGQGKANGHFK